MSDYAPCSACRRTFNTRDKGTWIRITGWVAVRGSDAKGGANAVRERRDTGDVLCPPCARARHFGVIPGQGALLPHDQPS